MLEQNQINLDEQKVKSYAKFMTQLYKSYIKQSYEGSNTITLPWTNEECFDETISDFEHGGIHAIHMVQQFIEAEKNETHNEWDSKVRVANLYVSVNITFSHNEQNDQFEVSFELYRSRQ